MQCVEEEIWLHNPKWFPTVILRVIIEIFKVPHHLFSLSEPKLVAVKQGLFRRDTCQSECVDVNINSAKLGASLLEACPHLETGFFQAPVPSAHVKASTIIYSGACVGGAGEIFDENLPEHDFYVVLGHVGTNGRFDSIQICCKYECHFLHLSSTQRYLCVLLLVLAYKGVFYNVFHLVLG